MKKMKNVSVMRKAEQMRKFAGIILAVMIMVTAAGCGNNSNISTNGEQKDTANNLSVGDTGQEEPDSYPELHEGDFAPNFTAEVMDGSSFTLSEQKGKVVLLNFWATWCGPCVGEMPAFEKLYNEYDGEVAILAVNCMESESAVGQFISDNGYTFPVACDEEGAVNMKYPTDGIPYTLVIDQEGIIQNSYLGAMDADTQYQEYKSAIDALLGK